MKRMISLLAILVLLTGFGAGYAQGRTAPADLSVYTTTDVVNCETTYKRYDMTFYEEPSTQPGTIVRLDYTTDVYGETLNTWANVYLPYGYDENGTQRYNIIYFTHGTNETQDSLLGDERVKNAIDNMIEVGIAEPFIMVCPTYYYDYETRATDHKTFVSEVRNDLMPLVESTYRTYAETVDDAGFIASREHRAFSGYSQGGAVMWTIFNDMLDRAKWFLPFSGSFGNVYENIKTALANYSEYADDFFVYLACGGKRDIAYENGNELMSKLLADDTFSYGLDPVNNNLYYCLSKEIHQTLMSRYYFYNAFVDVLFKQATVHKETVRMNKNQTANVLSLALVLVLLTLPAMCHAEQAVNREYVNLPELMVMEDGTPVTTQEEFEARRLELLQLFADTMYGPIPTRGFETAFEVLEEGDTLDGTAIRKQIRINVSTEKGSSDALMLLIVPKSDVPVPVVYGLSFDAVHTVLNDTQILASYSVRKYPNVDESTRGTQAGMWCIAEAAQRGYGMAIVFCDDFSPDNTRTYGKRIISLFDDPDFKGISAWAFGLERMADYLQTDQNVDASRLVVAGTSRLGKAALWAGANDERAALTIATVSGTCGASMSRSNIREQIGDMNASFRWWTRDSFKSYNDRVNELPVDQHELIACVAPRKIYVSSAETDLSNDSQGSWNAMMLSRDAFRLYGHEVIEDNTVEQPPVGTRVFTESMAYHMRSGNHGINADDWNNYFDYMDLYLK